MDKKEICLVFLRGNQFQPSLGLGKWTKISPIS